MKEEKADKIDIPREFHVKKPAWLKVKLGETSGFTKMQRIVQSHSLHTICSSGRCPNMGECWDRGTATFMIGGDICTRSCKFCNMKTGSQCYWIVKNLKMLLTL